MQKIPFSNLPDTTTPVNDTNLNLLQTNVENAINGVDDRKTGYYDFTIPGNGSKTLTFTYNNGWVGIFAAKTTLGGGINVSYMYGYQNGTSARYFVEQVITGGGHLSFSISDRSITISNSSDSDYLCRYTRLLNNEGISIS